MKLRYYLRGLGIGIIVTLILTGIAGNKKQELTNEEIKARAAELGMIEGTTLSGDPTPGLTQTPEPTQELIATPGTTQGTDEASGTETPTMNPDNTATPDLTQTPTVTSESTPTVTPEPTQAPTVTPEPTQTPIPTPEPTQAPTATPEPAQSDDDTQGTVVITVRHGDSSVKVSRMVEEAGLVESAQDFDRYLCANGYDKRLSVGTHEIPAGAGYEEIAKILTGR